MRKRHFLLQLFFLLVSAAVIVRLFTLQVLSYDFYKNLAENQHQLYETLVPVRGEIYIRGRDGGLIPIVANTEKDLVFAVPPEITEKTEVARSLAPILEMTSADILEKISDNDRKWVVLKKELTETVSLAVEELNLPGIYLQPEIHRLYPERDFASQVLGFVAFSGDNKTGQYGVEEYYQELLAGRSGSLSVDRDASGRWITGGVRKLEQAENGADIVLTIDRAIQYKTQAVLKQAVETNQADSGSIVVMDPKNGAILAMANYPSFDPNVFNTVEDASVFRNQSVSEAYEPGSVFKPITMVAGLDAGVITPDTTYEDKGFIEVDEFTIRNANKNIFGVVNMTQVLEQSINTGVIFVVNELGAEKFLQTIKRFGFGSPTGIGTAAEAAGSISNLIRGGEANYATASFGQGITVTPIQLAQAFSAIANDGKLSKPFLLETISNSDGTTEDMTPVEATQVVSAKAANTVAAMMVAVVENGHGKRAAVPGYYIAGKTGTAQVARVDGPGYDPDKTVGTFVGFGPVNNPQFVAVVKINNPKTVRFAESTAAPAFAEVAKFILNYYQIPPNR